MKQTPKIFTDKFRRFRGNFNSEQSLAVIFEIRRIASIKCLLPFLCVVRIGNERSARKTPPHEEIFHKLAQDISDKE